MKATETDIGTAVVNYMSEAYPGWTIYQEVCMGWGGERADIVATHEDPYRAWVIECKTSFTIDLLAQGERWIHCANYVSVATPRIRSSKHDHFRERLLNHFGLGHMVVDSTGQHGVREHVQAPLHRRKGFRTREYWEHYLREEHRTWAKAGSVNGYYSPFRATCDALRRYLKEKPGSTLKEVVANIQHHYASTPSAINSLRQWISNGTIKGIRIDVSGKAFRLYLEDQTVHK